MYETYAKLRDAKGFTDYSVAQKTGIGASTLSDWKTGKTTPKADKLLLIARLLGCTIEDLMEGTA